MAFDKDRHTFNAKGFMVDKETRDVVGQMPRPLEKLKGDGDDYPKWVKPHKDHVIEVHGNKVAPNHEFAIDRDSKEVHVLVHDAAEEEKAKRGHDRPERHHHHHRHEEPRRKR